MKSAWQIGFLIVVLMGVVAGTAYVIQYTSGAKAPEKSQTSPSPEPKAAETLYFPWGKIAVWRKDLGETLSEDQDTKKYLRMVEPLVEYSYDFSFYNAQPEPVTVTLTSRSCACGHVEGAAFYEQDWSAWQRERSAMAAEAFAGAPAILSALTTARLYRNLKWTKFENPKEKPDSTVSLIVPAAVGQFRQPGFIGHPGIIRVHFRPKEFTSEKKDDLKITLNARAGDLVSRPELLINYRAVPVTSHFPLTLEAGEIALGQRRTMELHVWSPTRPNLQSIMTIEGPEPSDRQHPCFEVGTPEPLSPDELRNLPQTLGQAQAKLDAQCGYRIPVTVHESRGGRQLDVGPFSRRLVFQVDAGDPGEVIRITGTIRGEFRVEKGDEYEKISLGDFKLERGAARTVFLTTARANLDLDLTSVKTSIDDLSAKLHPPETVAGQRRWKLEVEMKPNSAGGDLPASAAVVLQMREMRENGVATRKLRIPVTGRGTR